MPHKFMILPELDVFILNYSGHVVPDDFATVIKSATNSPDFDPGMTDLVLLSPDLDYSQVPFEMTRVQASRFVQRTASLKRPKFGAFICGGDAQMKMARMFSAFAMANAAPRVHVGCFGQLDEALDWVEAGHRRKRDRGVIRQCVTDMGAAWCLDEPGTGKAAPAGPAKA